MPLQRNTPKFPDMLHDKRLRAGSGTFMGFNRWEHQYYSGFSKSFVLAVNLLDPKMHSKRLD